VILNEDELDRVEQGDVLVCLLTTPTWNVAFGIVGAVVTETGGIVSHTAIAAREFGIPAVCGVRDVTTTVRDGQTLHVDGVAGTVRF
jgi:pyruvate,water dikinase